MSKKHNTVIYLIFTIILILVLALGKKIFSNSEANIIAPKMDTITLIPTPKDINKFNLISTKSNNLYNDMSGNWNVVFFGYTSCPHLCPTTLKRMNKIANLINTKINFILITIDPKRDTKEHLKDYLKKLQADNLNTEFLGGTGEKEEIHKLTKQLNIHVAKVNPEKVKHVDHSGALVVISPDMKFAGVIASPKDESLIAKELKEFINYYNKKYK